MLEKNILDKMNNMKILIYFEKLFSSIDLIIGNYYFKICRMMKIIIF